MSRKFWIAAVLCSFVLSMPMGGAAAQTQAPDATWRGSPPAALPFGRSTGKLSYRLAALAQSAQLRAASAEVQAQALSLPAQGAGSLITDAQSRILVDVRVSEASGPVLAALAQAHAAVTYVSTQYQVVTVLISPSDLAGLAAIPAVQSVMEELTPLVGDGAPAPLAAGRRAAASTCPVGTAVSAGDVQLNASAARSTFSINGSGVKVGVLSDSFDADAAAVTHAAADVASGDLPGAANTCGFTTPVQVISETLAPGSATDEGRAMVQIVHDLAPGATLAFASAHNGLYQFAANIRALRTAGADIIVDDVTYFAEPMFQEGPVAVAIGDVTSAGAAYFTSAGNSNAIVGGHNVASYEAPNYRPVTVPAYLASQGYESCHDFNPGAPVDATYGITLDPGGSVNLILNYSEPWFGVTTDFDILVTNAANTLIAAGQDVNIQTQLPFEHVSWSNATGVPQTYNIHVCRFTGSGGGDTLNPRLKWVMLRSQGLTAVEYPTSAGGDIIGPAIMGHSASLYSLSVAAAPVTDNNNPEPFSSFGPATHYFGPVVGNTAAGAISPLVIHQPDFTASDGGCTTFFAQNIDGCWRFFGTSAAAPHAAAVAALLKQKVNQNHLVSLTQGTTKFLLQSTARNMSGGLPDGVGAGLIDASGVITKELTFTNHLLLPYLRR